MFWLHSYVVSVPSNSTLVHLRRSDGEVIPVGFGLKGTAAVTRYSFYDTPLTCFQYGAPNRRFTSEMGRNAIPLGMEFGARRPC